MGGDATAAAIAQLGLLRSAAQSSVGTQDPETAALARATAAFADVGTIALPGGTVGDLVHAFVTVDIEGTHNNGVSGITDAHLNVGATCCVDLPPNGVYQFDAHVGDVVHVSLGLSIFADASYLNPFSVADYGNSAHLHFDFQEPGVYFDSNRGHDYSWVPAPSPAGCSARPSPVFAVVAFCGGRPQADPQHAGIQETRFGGFVLSVSAATR